jgi:cytosine deaminase
VEQVIERTRGLGFQGRVVASHCSVLSALPFDEAQRLIAGLAAAGIGVITLPAANLFLQGRDASRLPPRGLTRVTELLAAGVPVACGSDNIQDPFVPTGSGDMLEMARWTFLAGHLGCGDLAQAYAMATAIPAQLLGLGETYGLHEGARADLVITPAEDAEDLVASGPLERAVFCGGKLVAGRV